MIDARLLWPPHPYKAGFCITDDPDASTFPRTRAVYDHLLSKSFVTTKAVWAFEPADRCGIPAIPDSVLRGVTLEDPDFFSYCRDIHRAGVEVCLHGASAGNNTRERTRQALDLFEEHFGETSTFICHSKNAENIYWEHLATRRFPFQTLLRARSTQSCSGEDETSPYFWGDLCRARVNQIRLFRTRRRNTLKRNPSMPYHDPAKPCVNGWFSATKRSLADCATEEALESLKRECGLTILYQYLHRYADPVTLALKESLIRPVDRIAADPEILVATVSAMMRRLRLMQGIFILYRERFFWLVNANDEPVQDLQIAADAPFSVQAREEGIANFGRGIVVRRLAPRSLRRFEASEPIRFRMKNARQAGHEGRSSFRLPFGGELSVDLPDEDDRNASGDGRPQERVHLKALRGGNGLPLLSDLPYAEEMDLARDQFALIAREVLLGRRSLNIEKYLDTSRGIPLEQHEYW